MALAECEHIQILVATGDKELCRPGVTIKFSGNTVSGPIFWLAKGDVDIEGTLDLSGGNGALFVPSTTSFERQPSVPGSGGFAGGVGGNSAEAPLPGNGIGGGAAGFPASPSGLGESIVAINC